MKALPRTAWYFIAVLVFVLLVLSKYRAGHGFTELIGFGEQWDGQKTVLIDEHAYWVKPASGGYDGQFYAQIALDPTLRTPDLATVIDSPAYRARRILLPALAYALGGGRPGAILQVFALLNVAFWLAFAWLLLKFLPPDGWANFGKWCVCLFSMGVLESVRLSLTDLPAAFFTFLAVWLWQNKRVGASVGANALALFTKETALLNWVLYATRTSLEPRHRWKILCGSLVAFGLMGAWLFYCNTVFPAALNASNNFGMPFAGICQSFLEALRELGQGNFDSRYVFRAVAVPGLLYQLYYLVRYRQPAANLVWSIGIIYGVLFVFLNAYVWSGYWAVTRVVLPMSIAYVILLKVEPGWKFWARLLLPNLVMVHALIRWI